MNRLTFLPDSEMRSHWLIASVARRKKKMVVNVHGFFAEVDTIEEFCNSGQRERKCFMCYQRHRCAPIMKYFGQH